MKTKERKCDNILKRIVSGVLIAALTISMPIPYTTKNKTVKAETISREVEWNIKCLNAEKSYEESKNLKKIKVAILDSGLDYDPDLPAVERKDFLGEKELHPLYQDMTGHGTSVASLICARENEDRITGIAANVELYIGRIFGYGNNAPVERVVRAVNWAIEEKVNIIHMSFGTEEYSGELEDAIEKAYKSGILIIAAAGNAGQAPEDESTIEYPAAFDNVISVGATNKYNNMSDFSATGKELDVVAPGDQILTDGAFGGVAVDKGTSISAAQVTGVAAVLWGKHPDKSNAFIKSLLVGSANKEAVNSEECGQGLIDYKEADKNYKEMNEAYKEYKEDGASEKKAVEKAEKEIPENTKSVEEHGEVNYVNASWGRNAHKTIVEEGNKKGNETYILADDIDYVKMGVMHSDSYDQWNKMSLNPYFHGRDNYFVNTHYLYCLAKKYIGEDATFPTKEELKVNGRYLKDNKINAISKKLKATNELSNYFKSFQNKEDDFLKDYSEEARKQIETNKKTQGYVLLGAAIHNLTDIFSHNVYKKTLDKYGGVWCSTVHDNRETALNWAEKVDDDKVGPNEKRYLRYLLKNFAITDKRKTEKKSVHMESMYKLASKAGICVLASMDSENTWYDLLETVLKKAKKGKLRLKEINEQWKILTGEEGKFKNLCVGKNNKKKKIKISYSLKIGEKDKRRIIIKVKNACGYSVYGGNNLLNVLEPIKPIRLKKGKVTVRSYRGHKAKEKNFDVKFKIKYSCKGMKNVRLKKGKTNREQEAEIKSNVTFVPKGGIFEKTKGKKKFKGWYRRKKNGEQKNYYLGKKYKYPANEGNSITLYPLFG